MANGINNKYEYRSGLLDSLNVQHTASDVRNEDEYRKKVLNGLGVEYTEDDINQKNLYRAKVVEGLASSGGGGGSSDFSTAQVTFNSNTAETIQLMVPVATEEGIDIKHAVRNGRTLVVPLYNGSCIVGANDSYEGDFTDFSVTGNIRIDAKVGSIIVSGDGTITYTPAP